MPDPNTNTSSEQTSLPNPATEAHTAHTQPQSPGKHARLLWFLLIPALLLAFGLYRWRSDAKAHKALTATTTAGVAEPVTVQQPQFGLSTSDLVLPATLQAFAESPIYARTNGYVSHWFTDIGRSVSTGEMLATIDSPEVDQQLIQTRAALGQAEANLQLANTTTQRYKDLIKSDSVAQQEVDQNVQNLTSQQEAVISGKANVANLEKQQSYEHVLAPFSGVVTERRIDVGDLINAGNSGNGAELFRISRIDVMRIFVAVPEEYSQQMKPGLHAQVQLTELPTETFDGIIARSNHAIDPNTRTLTVEVDVANRGGKLLPGAYGSVHFKLVQARRPLMVPTGSVLFQQAGPQVAVVTPQNQVNLHKVAIGRDLGNTIEITGGLSPLDRIISSPPDYLVDGMPVSVQATPSPQSKQAAAPGKS